MKKAVLLATCAMVTTIAVTPAMAQENTTAEEATEDDNVIVVTAQRQAQSLQEVPIAVSAFDADALDSQQIENASDLQLTLPNVSFTRGNFNGSSFTIRGIGDLCVGDSCDSATAIHLNSAPLFNTRLFETEYYDLERIEVLRGPQGTLFGRNATSGVVNIVTAKPVLGEFSGSIEGEYGNFDAFKVEGVLNVPIGDTLAVRAAGYYLKRDGFTENLFDGTDIDDRDIYSVRGSLRWEPGPDTQIDLVASYFREDDNRLRIQKQQCQRDPTGVLGCLNARRDNDKTNINATFTGTLTSAEFLAIAGIPTAFALGSVNGPDSHAGFVEPDDVRQVATDFTPTYFAEELQLQAHIEHDFGPIKASLTGTFQDIRFDSQQDTFLSVFDTALFAPAIGALQGAAAGAIPGLPAPFFAPFADAILSGSQLCTSTSDFSGLGSFGGNRICADTPLNFDRSNQDDKSWSVEAIFTSNFDGPFNFLLGGIYADAEITRADYFVNAFTIDYLGGLLGAFTALGTLADADPTNDLPPLFFGTPFFRTQALETTLESFGIFGEAYVDFTDELQLTIGLRYNNDDKFTSGRNTLVDILVPFGTTGDITNSPLFPLFDADPQTPGIQPTQDRSASFDEITGRAVLNWQVTPDNLVYASYSRGYKSGGINPPIPDVFAVPGIFAPENINAFEIGSKNTLANGALQLNATAFFYDYKDLQLSRIVARTSVNDNIDARVYGIELEAIVRPDPDWLFNINFSWLETEANEDTLFVNQRDPSGGDPNSVIIKDLQAAFNCAVTSGSLANTAAFVTAVNGALGLQGPTAFPVDSGLGTTLGAFSLCDVLVEQAPALAGFFPGIQVFAGQSPEFNAGIPVSIDGNSLPQAPVVKASIGAQHTVNFDSGMTLIPRVDITYTGEQFGNIFNGPVNKINGFVQANAQIQLNGADENWFVRAFVQNIFDSNSTTGFFLSDQTTGLFSNIFTLDPRRFGVSAGFSF